MRAIVLVSIIVCVALFPCFGRCQSRTDNSDVICVSESMMQPCRCIYISNYVQQTIYLAVINPSQPIASLACRLRAEPGEGFFGEWLAADGWVNAAEDPDLELSFLDEPATSDFVIVAINTIVVIDDSIMNEIYIDPPDGEESLEYLDPSGNPVPLVHDTDFADAYLNSGGFCLCVTPVSASCTWSEVKALYR